MSQRLFLISSAAMIALAGCGRDAGTAGNDAANAAANLPATGSIEEAPAVPLVDADGTIIGEVRGGESDEGVVLWLKSNTLPPGIHGLHLHDVGRCEGPGFESAGPHWNPTNAQHGLQNPRGPHLGDLPNLTVGADGIANAKLTIIGSVLKPSREHGGGPTVLDANGAALIIHAGPDDNRTDPAGNSGGRIACAVLAEPGGA